MLAVVSCNKYHNKTLRIADIGDRDQEQAQVLLSSMNAWECPICGPCSHVELSWNNRFTVHHVCADLKDAVEFAKQLDSQNPGEFQLQVA
jgi:hypothetical protein